MDEVAKTARAKGLAIRIWVSFADCQSESPDNYGALSWIALTLGLTYRKCPVQWAAYYASNEKPVEAGSEHPVEPSKIPNRPTSALEKIKAAAVAASMSLGVGISNESGTDLSTKIEITRDTQLIEGNADKLIQQDSQVNRFSELAQIWRTETQYLSSPSTIVEHTAYQEIIAMGNSAIPLIMSEMAMQPGQWFAALRVITRENPVLPEISGNVQAMTEVWLEWGRAHGYR